MKKIQILILCFLMSNVLIAQDSFLKSADLHIGYRFIKNVTLTDNYSGNGVELQCGLKLEKWLSAEIFGNFENTDVSGVGGLKNKQIGASISFFPLKNKKVQPYIHAGINYNFLKTIPVSYLYNNKKEDVLSTTNTGIHFGLGAHFFILEKLSIGPSISYLKLFNSPNFILEDTDFGLVMNTNPLGDVDIKTPTSIYLKISVNYTISKLW